MSNTITCLNCGATCKPKDRARFSRRHPSKCTANLIATTEKRMEMRKLAAGTRCVDDQDGRPVRPKRVNAKVSLV